MFVIPRLSLFGPFLLGRGLISSWRCGRETRERRGRTAKQLEHSMSMELPDVYADPCSPAPQARLQYIFLIFSSTTLQSVHFEPLYKMGMWFKYKFWEQAENPSMGGRTTTTDLSIRWIVFPSNGIGASGSPACQPRGSLQRMSRPESQHWLSPSQNCSSRPLVLSSPPRRRPETPCFFLNSR